MSMLGTPTSGILVAGGAAPARQTVVTVTHDADSDVYDWTFSNPVVYDEESPSLVLTVNGVPPDFMEQISSTVIRATYIGLGDAATWEIASNPFHLKWVSFPQDGVILEEDVETGMILPYGGSTAPTGYLVCNGAAVSRTTYATLFGVVATAFGVGDGSTTFNLPDLRGRFPLGKAAAGTGSTLGQAFGTFAHTHELATGGTVTEGAHLHALDSVVTEEDGDHTHEVTLPNADFLSVAGVSIGVAADVYNTNGSGTHHHSVSGSTTSEGAHQHALTGATDVPDQTPPLQVVTYIIKT